MDRKTIELRNRISRRMTKGTAMRISLVASLLFHVFLLFGFQKAFPIHWMVEPLRTYRVELIRPPVDEYDEAETGGTDLSETNPSGESPVEDTEDTISLDTKDERYRSYADVIKERLLRQWVYPEKAKKALVEGEVLVQFTLNREGHLIGFRFLKPSNFDILDNETERTIRAAAPFPPFPGSVTVTRLHIRANFAYRLTTRR